MTKFNFDLNKSGFSTKHELTAIERELVEDQFSMIAEYIDVIPEETYENMHNIEQQLIDEHKLSDKQIEYVRSIYEKYCT